MPVAPEHASGGPVYFAWADADETTFGPEHIRYDEYITELNIHLEAGKLPTAQLTMKNPGPLLAAGRKRWAWIAFLVDGEVVPKFFGSVVAIPGSINGPKVVVQFIAKPLDYLARKQAAADALKVPPYYNRFFIDDKLLDDPDTILEAIPGDWHHDPVTHAVTVSDWLVGEDGVKEFTSNKVIYGSLDWSIGAAPKRAVSCVATVTWKQTATGTLELPRVAFTGPIANAVLNAWPKAGTQFSDAYSCESSFASDTAAVDRLQTASYSWSYQNKEKEHNNGDTMSANWSINTITGPGVLPLDVIPRIGQLFNYQESTQRTAGDEETGQARSLQHQWSGTLVVPYKGFADLTLRYKAERDRTEHLKFTLSVDLQAIVNDDGGTDDIEVMTLSGGDVGRLIDGVPAIGDLSRRDFFSGSVGKDAREYVFNVARAKLLETARPIRVGFGTPFVEALATTCRMNGLVHHPDLPGGEALGKVDVVDLDCDGNAGLFSGKVQLLCAVGNGVAVEEVEGTPTYADADVFGPDLQVFTGRIIALPSGDLGYTPPVDGVNDDGLVFNPLTLDQVLVRYETIAEGDPLAELVKVRGSIGGTVERIEDLVARGNETADAVDKATAKAELHQELELKPINRPFEHEHLVTLTALTVPQQVNLGAS